MPRFLVLLAAGLASAILYRLVHVALGGSLAPSVVPLAAGLVAWSAMIVVLTPPPIERRVSTGHRLNWQLGAQVGLVLALLDGVPLWRLPGGDDTIVLVVLLGIPVVALTHVTTCALFTRAEREACSGHRHARTEESTGAPPA